MPQIEVLVGLDVSGSQIDAHVLPGDPACRVANDAAGRAELLRWLQAAGVELAVLEASGGCERQLVRELRAAELAVRVVDPRRVREFASAAGKRAKNGLRRPPSPRRGEGLGVTAPRSARRPAQRNPGHPPTA